ncbi:MAG: hypothetical protein M0C28_40050 [Candidatus Moduliflexus flocculans]|nr:hypothetical protein [Candidatus Moduliflexus flocculans]
MDGDGPDGLVVRGKSADYLGVRGRAALRGPARGRGRGRQRRASTDDRLVVARRATR